MDDQTWRRRIDEDMARVPGMTFREALAFLNNYSSRTFGDQLARGELTTERVYRYADQALARAWREHEQKLAT